MNVTITILIIVIVAQCIINCIMIKRDADHCEYEQNLEQANIILEHILEAKKKLDEFNEPRKED